MVGMIKPFGTKGVEGCKFPGPNPRLMWFQRTLGQKWGRFVAFPTICLLACGDTNGCDIDTFRAVFPSIWESWDTFLVISAGLDFVGAFLMLIVPASYEDRCRTFSCVFLDLLGLIELTQVRHSSGESFEAFIISVSGFKFGPRAQEIVGLSVNSPF